MSKAPARRRNRFRVDKEVRKLARERVGSAPAGRVLTPKPRKPLRHPKREQESWVED